MNIGILGTGNLALTLGQAWAAIGHTILVAGRDDQRARSVADEIGPLARAVGPGDLAGTADVVVLAVSWDGLESALASAGGPSGQLGGKTLIDCTNPVDHQTGRLLLAFGSAAETVVAHAPGANVVKALHLFAGGSWPFEGSTEEAPVVPMCGDDSSALAEAASLVADLGGHTAVLGGLDTARQAEEVAGFVMRLVAAGANPRWAVPDVSPA